MNSEQEKPKSIFDELAEKLRKKAAKKETDNGSGSSSAAKPSNDISDMLSIFDCGEKIRKRKTEIIKVQEAPAVPECLKPEPKVTDFSWNEPFDIYGRMLRKEGAGFGDKEVIQFLIWLDDARDCVNTPSASIGNSQKEGILHYAGMCYLGLWIGGYIALQGKMKFSEISSNTSVSMQNMYQSILMMAKNSFKEHNVDAVKEEATLEKMCSKEGMAYDIFQKTIWELVGLFAKQFSEMPPELMSSYHDVLHSNKMKDLLASLGSENLTTPLLQIEYLSNLLG